MSYIPLPYRQIATLISMEKKLEPISHRFIFFHATVAFLITTGIAWVTPLSFSGFRTDQSLSRFFLFLSDSGAQWGALSIMLFATVLVVVGQTGIKKRILTAILFLTGLTVVLVTFAFINEFVTKPFFAFHRPYVLKLEKEGLLSADKFYALATKQERSDFLRKKLAASQNSKIVQSLDSDIREHWIAHTGFSFPSGHSQNVFLFAVILAFLIQHLVSDGKRFVWIPFLWATGVCLSRVAMGVHSPIDITVGALTGGLLGSLVLMSGLPNRILPEKQAGE